DQETPAVVVDPGDLDGPAGRGAADETLPDVDGEDRRQIDGRSGSAHADARIAADHHGLDRALHRLRAVVRRCSADRDDGRGHQQERTPSNPQDLHRRRTILRSCTCHYATLVVSTAYQARGPSPDTVSANSGTGWLRDAPRY